MREEENDKSIRGEQGMKGEMNKEWKERGTRNESGGERGK